MEKKEKGTPSFFSEKIKQLFKPSYLSSKNICISLDIGSAYVKVVALEKTAQAVNIHGFGHAKIEKDIKEAIRNTLSSLPVKKKELSVSLSGSNVVLRYVHIPTMSHEEISKSMAFELERYIPFNKDEINFDFAILKKNKNTGKMLVLIVAAKKDLVDSRIFLCRELGYQLSFIDVCPLALANYFEFTSSIKDKVCAIVNLGASVSSISIIEDGLLVLSRDIFIGGNDFTKKLSEALNKDFKEAEEIKMGPLNDSLLQSLEPVFSNLIKELKVSFDFYETQENRLIDKILITGGSSHLKGMLDYMKHYLGQNIELVDFDEQKLKLSPSLDAEKFKENFNSFTFALGMGFRNF